MALGDSDVVMSQIDTLCTGDFVGISGSSSVCNSGNNPGPTVNRYCGTFLNAVAALAADAVVCGELEKLRNA